MSKCKRCHFANPASGIDSAGRCAYCCMGMGLPFVPYSGRRPENGDRQAGGCPQCGWPLDGVFMCVGCEEQAAEQLRTLAISQEWYKQTPDGWTLVPHWYTLKQELLNDLALPQANRELP